MSMNLTNYRQSERLRALGMPPDERPQVMYVDTEDGARVEYWGAITDVHSAIMWLLQTERGRELWGDGSFDVGVFTRPDGRSDLRSELGPWGLWGDTPSDLLNAMLDAMEAKS